MKINSQDKRIEEYLKKHELENTALFSFKTYDSVKAVTIATFYYKHACCCLIDEAGNVSVWYKGKNIVEFG